MIDFCECSCVKRVTSKGTEGKRALGRPSESIEGTFEKLFFHREISTGWPSRWGTTLEQVWECGENDDTWIGHDGSRVVKVSRRDGRERPSTFSPLALLVRTLGGPNERLCHFSFSYSLSLLMMVPRHKSALYPDASPFTIHTLEVAVSVTESFAKIYMHICIHIDINVNLLFLLLFQSKLDQKFTKRC